MPTIDINPRSALPITELIFPDPAGSAARSNSEKLFDDYLNRANAVAKPPAAGDKAANRGDADRFPPSKTAAGPRPAEHADAALPPSDEREGDPPSEATARTEDDRSSAGDAARSKANEGREERAGAKEAQRDESKDGDAQPSEETVGEEQKKTKKEINGSESAAESTAADGKLPIGLPANADVQPSKAAIEQKVAGEESSVEAKPMQDVAESDLRWGNPASKSVETADGDADLAKSASKNDALAIGENPDAAKRSAAGNPAEAILDAAGKGKSKSKKTREAAANAKNAPQKQNAAGSSPADVPAKESAETPSAPVVKEAGIVAKGDSAIPQASDNALQAMLDVLKAAEKPAQTKSFDAPTAEVRVNSAAASDRAAAGREAGAAPAPAGSDPAAQALRAQFVQRVERAFAAMGNRNGTVRLKLSPPELGVLKLEIGVRKGVMKARIEAETPAAKSLLLDNLPELRERLAQQNIHIQQFDVDLMDRSPGGMPRQTSGQGDSGAQRGDRPPTREPKPEIPFLGPAAAANATQRPGMGGSLNVIV
ncbi:MAG: flagellar hook-length control protein FliK [Pirellulales bacterium]|nr:flagellar hook-length control protein FliK [Pirellulales bacterium]